ncbi:MAG TPA: HEAT repeat domain-containing protein [Acidimicrobiia bacterium]
MTAIEAAVVGVVVACTIGLVLAIAVVALKWAHRRRVHSHEIRRREYLRMISAHVVQSGSIPVVSAQEAEDDAFIDAVIDVRNTIAGSPDDALNGLVDSSGLTRRQAGRLRSPFPLGRRLRAAVSLAEIGDRGAARVLLAHLSDREPEIRIQSARGLARMRYVAAIGPILARLAEETPAVRSMLAEALVAFGRDAAWPITAFIRAHHKDPVITGIPEAARAIGTIGDSEVGNALSELLFEIEDVEILLALIESLGYVGGPHAVRPLRRTLASEDWRLRAKSATALGEIGDPSVNPILFSGLRDQSWWTRRNCAAALSVLPGGIGWLYDGLISHDEFARDAAAEALADCGELAAARDRVDAGVSRPRDLQLLNYMASPGMVFS